MVRETRNEERVHPSRLECGEIAHPSCRMRGPREASRITRRPEARASAESTHTWRTKPPLCPEPTRFTRSEDPGLRQANPDPIGRTTTYGHDHRTTTGRSRATADHMTTTRSHRRPPHHPTIIRSRAEPGTRSRVTPGCRERLCLGRSTRPSSPSLGRIVATGPPLEPGPSSVQQADTHQYRELLKKYKSRTT